MGISYVGTENTRETNFLIQQSNNKSVYLVLRDMSKKMNETYQKLRLDFKSIFNDLLKQHSNLVEFLVTSHSTPKLALIPFFWEFLHLCHAIT